MFTVHRLLFSIKDIKSPPTLLPCVKGDSISVWRITSSVT